MMERLALAILILGIVIQVVLFVHAAISARRIRRRGAERLARRFGPSA